MPKEEKGKKRFKAVTEEISSPEMTEEKEEAQSNEIESSEVEDVVEDTPQEEKPMLSVRETDNYEANPKPEKGMFLKIFLVTFFATLMAFLLAGGIYVYLSGTRSLDGINLPVNQTPQPEPSATAEPSATPEPNVDVSKYSVSVLNGNGGIGVAGAAKTVIESAGFKVSNTGNAGSFDFEETEISVKSGVPASVVAKLKESLLSKYSVKIGEALKESSTYDIVVTVGAK